MVLKLANLFRSAQLKSLLGSEEAREWISPDITDKKSTQQLYCYLRYQVNVDEVQADDLPWKLDEPFLSNQNVAWFSRFYRFLLKHPSLWFEVGGALRAIPIIRLVDGSNVTPFGVDGANAFLPTGGESGPKTVNPLLAKGDSLTFLRKLGIRERDAVAEVLEDILPQYESGTLPAETKHLRNLGRIFRTLEQKESPDYDVLVTVVSHLFRDACVDWILQRRIIRGVVPCGTCCLQKGETMAN